MRGLPEPPPDFVFWQVAWEVSDSTSFTTGWYFFCPGAGTASPADLETLAGQLFFSPLSDLLGIVGTDVTVSAFRLRTYGTSPFTLLYAPAPNSGGFGHTAPNNAALCLTWRGNTPGRGLEGHSFLPLARELVDANGSTLTSIGWSQAQAAARGFVQHLNALISPDGGTCVLAILHRSHAGVPYAAAQWEPVELGDASARVGTLRRRIRTNSPFSSPF